MLTKNKVLFSFAGIGMSPFRLAGWGILGIILLGPFVSPNWPAPPDPTKATWILLGFINFVVCETYHFLIYEK